MAKKRSGPNKSAAIRAYYEAHPKAMPKEVLAALTKDGVKTTTAFISTIRTNMKKGLGTGKPGRPSKFASKQAATKRGTSTAGRRAQASPAGAVSMDSLLRVKKVVEEMGSVDEARNALNALEKLLK